MDNNSRSFRLTYLGGYSILRLRIRIPLLLAATGAGGGAVEDTRTTTYLRGFSGVEPEMDTKDNEWYVLYSALSLCGCAQLT